MAPSCLTVDDCHSVLNNFEQDGLSFSKFNLKPYCKDVRGYLGEHLLLTIDVTNKEDENEQLSFFVKSLNCPGLSECFVDTDFFEKEVFVYTLLQEVKTSIPDLYVRSLPRLYHHTKDRTLVLENLAVKGYKGVTEFNLDGEHMLKCLEYLAKFHAVSLVYEKTKSRMLGREYRLDEDFEQFFEPLFNNNKDKTGNKYYKSAMHGNLQLVDIFIKDATEAKRLKGKFEELFNQNIRLLNEKNNFRKVLCHGDLWAFNMLFKYEKDRPIRCKFVDFQLVRYAPPAHDVVSVCYWACSRKMRQERLHEFYLFYYKNLTKELDKFSINIDEVLTWDEYKETLELFMPLAKATWLCYRQTSAISAKNMEQFISDKSLLQAVVLTEERANFVKLHCQTDTIYKQYIEGLFNDNVISLNYTPIALEDCYELVEKKTGRKNYMITNYEIRPLSERGGFLGDHFILHLQIDKLDNLQYFVKVTPTADWSRDFIINSGVAYKEKQFFNQLIPDFLKEGVPLLEQTAPKHYLSSLSKVITDNLLEFGYTMISVRVGMAVRELKAAIKAMAKLHASGFIYEERTKRKLIEMYPKEFEEAFYTNHVQSIRLLSAARKGFEEQVRIFSNYTTNITAAEFSNIGGNIIDNYKNLIKPSKKFRNTINHGDLWPHNILVKLNENEDGCFLVDYQSYRYMPPASDLMQFIYLSSTRATRKAHLQELLDFYYEQFKSLIEAYSCDISSILTYENFLRSCDEEKMFAVSQTVTHFQNVQMSNDRINEFFADYELGQKVFNSDRSDNVRHCCDTDPVYRTKAEEAIMDFREVCEEYAKKFGVNAPLIF